jgi:hypothetical protein
MYCKTSCSELHVTGVAWISEVRTAVSVDWIQELRKSNDLKTKDMHDKVFEKHSVYLDATVEQTQTGWRIK